MNLKERTTEKLEGELRGLKIIIGVLIGLLGLLFLVGIYGLLTKDKDGVFGALIIIPIGLVPILLLNFENMKKIKIELESRK